MIYAALVILAAAAGAAATGFGFNLFSAPLLAAVYPPRTIVALTLALGTVTSGVLLARPEIRLGADWKLVGRMSLSSLAGMPLGLFLLLHAHPVAIKVAIAGLTAAFAASRLTGVRPRVRPAPWQAVAAGVVSGILSTGTSLNGPPVALLLLWWGQSKDLFRANIVAFVFLTTLASVGLLVLSGAMPPPTIRLALALVPCALLGYAGGIAVAARLSERGFERTVLGFLLVVGILGAVQALA
ncbi:MAG TPA: sulfite exporter TauE/SafE family protein [bacterium]|nr:sulfite exporter TauE/SafE family protein [bacterium]